MSRSAFDVFLSYRRDKGAPYAQLIYAALTAKGYSVFMDVRDLSSGAFDTSLLDVICNAEDIIVILTPGSLDRCCLDDDWLRREIRDALKHQRNVVPLLIDDFRMPSVEHLPDDVMDFARQQSVVYSHEYCVQSIERLIGMLRSKPRQGLDTGWFQRMFSNLLVGSMAGYLGSKVGASDRNETTAATVPTIKTPSQINIMSGMWHFILTEASESVSGTFTYSPGGSGSGMYRFDGPCVGERTGIDSYRLFLFKGTVFESVVRVNARNHVVDVDKQQIDPQRVRHAENVVNWLRKQL